MASYRLSPTQNEDDIVPSSCQIIAESSCNDIKLPRFSNSFDGDQSISDDKPLSQSSFRNGRKFRKKKLLGIVSKISPIKSQYLDDSFTSLNDSQSSQYLSQKKPVESRAIIDETPISKKCNELKIVKCESFKKSLNFSPRKLSPNVKDSQEKREKSDVDKLLETAPLNKSFEKINTSVIKQPVEIGESQPLFSEEIANHNFDIQDYSEIVNSSLKKSIKSPLKSNSNTIKSSISPLKKSNEKLNPQLTFDSCEINDSVSLLSEDLRPAILNSTFKSPDKNIDSFKLSQKFNTEEKILNNEMDNSTNDQNNENNIISESEPFFSEDLGNQKNIVVNNSKISEKLSVSPSKNLNKTFKLPEILNNSRIMVKSHADDQKKAPQHNGYNFDITYDKSSFLVDINDILDNLENSKSLANISKDKTDDRKSIDDKNLKNNEYLALFSPYVTTRRRYKKNIDSEKERLINHEEIFDVQNPSNKSNSSDESDEFICGQKLPNLSQIYSSPKKANIDVPEIEVNSLKENCNNFDAISSLRNSPMKKKYREINDEFCSQKLTFDIVNGDHVNEHRKSSESKNSDSSVDLIISNGSPSKKKRKTVNKTNNVEKGNTVIQNELDIVENNSNQTSLSTAYSSDFWSDYPPRNQKHSTENEKVNENKENSNDDSSKMENNFSNKISNTNGTNKNLIESIKGSDSEKEHSENNEDFQSKVKDKHKHHSSDNFSSLSNTFDGETIPIQKERFKSVNEESNSTKGSPPKNKSITSNDTKNSPRKKKSRSIDKFPNAEKEHTISIDVNVPNKSDTIHDGQKEDTDDHLDKEPSQSFFTDDKKTKMKNGKSDGENGESDCTLDRESSPSICMEDGKRKKKNRKSDGEKGYCDCTLDSRESGASISKDDRKTKKKKRKTDREKRDSACTLDGESGASISRDDRKTKKKKRNSDGEKGDSACTLDGESGASISRDDRKPKKKKRNSDGEKGESDCSLDRESGASIPRDDRKTKKKKRKTDREKGDSACTLDGESGASISRDDRKPKKKKRNSDGEKGDSACTLDGESGASISRDDRKPKKKKRNSDGKKGDSACTLDGESGASISRDDRKPKKKKRNSDGKKGDSACTLDGESGASISRVDRKPKKKKRNSDGEKGESDCSLDRESGASIPRDDTKTKKKKRNSDGEKRESDCTLDRESGASIFMEARKAKKKKRKSEGDKEVSVGQLDIESSPHVSTDDRKRKKKNRQSDGDKEENDGHMDAESAPQDTESTPHVSTDDRKRKKKNRQSDGEKEENDGHMDAESTPQDTESTPHVSPDDKKRKKKNRQSDGDKEENDGHMDAESAPQDTESTPHVSTDDRKRKKKNRQSDGEKVVSVDQLDIESSPHVSTDERKRVKKRRKSDGDKEENDGHMDAESTPQDTESTPHVSTDDRKNKKKNRQSDGEKESVIDIHSSTTDIDLDVSSPNKREKKSKKFVEKDVKSDDWKSDNELNVEDKPRRMADKNSLQRKTYKENDSNQSISEILLNLPLDDYSLSEKEIAKIQKKISYRFSDSVYTKLEKLRIEITWKLSPIHQVEVIFRGSCNNNPKYKEMIGVVKKGLFETYENQAIVSRWNQFCQLYDFNVKKDFLLFLPKLTGCHCHPLPKDQRIKFVQFIAQDLPKRSLHSVYYRFIEMFKYYKKGVFSQEEDNLILLMHKVLPVNRVYSVLSNILYRSRYTVYRRYKRLEKRGINNQSHESESFDENEPPTSSKKRKRRIINVNDKDEENYEQQTSKIEILSSDCDIDFEKNNTSKEISSISKTPSNLNVITNSNQILETVLKPSGPFKIKPLNLDADVTNLKLDQETVDLDEDFDSLKSVISNITGSQDLTKWDNKARKVSFWKRIGRKCNLSPAKAKLQYLCRIRVKELKPKKSHNCNSLILQIIDCLKKNNWKKWKHVDWKLVSEELNNLGDVFLYYTFRKYVKKYVPETSWRKLKDCINHLSEHTVLPSCC